MNITSSGGTFGGPPELIRRFLIQGSKVAEVPQRDPRPVPVDRRIRVLAVVHGWFPELAAGSERMVQHMLDALPEDEFEVRVWHFGIGEAMPTDETDYVHEGTPVRRSMNPPPGYVPDIVLFHHGYAARVIPSLYEQWPHVRVVAVHHNERYDTEDILRAGADLSVFNTRWVRESLGIPGLVVHPPIEPGRHEVARTGDAVTLVNLQENKGVRTFARLADRMPGIRFLGVEGTHGEQELGLFLPTPNVDLWPVTQDMREVWAQTKVVLMPSAYESYGMVAAEACVNGIPVIAHPTQGLVECLGNSGLFVDRDDTDGYERTIHLLMTDPQFYAERSAMSRVHGQTLVRQSRTELRRFVRRLRQLVSK